MITQLLLLLAATLLCFGLFCFFRHFFDGTVLISVAIGAAINANLYTAGGMPISAGWLTVGIDAMLYTLFMFAIICKAHDYSIAEAKGMSVATIVAILVSALIEMLAKWSFKGSLDWELGQIILRYVFSCIATLIGIWAMLFVYSKFKAWNMNVYLNFALVVLLASVLNTLVYCSLDMLMTWRVPENFGQVLAGTYVGKAICILLGDLAYFINARFWKPRHLPVRYRNYDKAREEKTK